MHTRICQSGYTPGPTPDVFSEKHRLFKQTLARRDLWWQEFSLPAIVSVESNMWGLINRSHKPGDDHGKNTTPKMRCQPPNGRKKTTIRLVIWGAQQTSMYQTPVLKHRSTRGWDFFPTLPFPSARPGASDPDPAPAQSPPSPWRCAGSGGTASAPRG